MVKLLKFRKSLFKRFVKIERVLSHYFSHFYLRSALTNFYQYYVQNEQVKEDVLDKVVS